MSETDIVTVGRALPKLASVEAANAPFSVSVVWATGDRAGQTDVIDLAPMIHTFKVFRPLRDDRALFAAVRLGEWGQSIVWDGNEDLDIGADSLEDLAEETMTSADFVAFMKRNSLTLDAAAAQLGISRRLVAYYAKERAIPRTIALACKYLDLTFAGIMASDEGLSAYLHLEQTALDNSGKIATHPLHLTTGAFLHNAAHNALNSEFLCKEAIFRGVAKDESILQGFYADNVRAKLSERVLKSAKEARSIARGETVAARFFTPPKSS